MNKINIGTDFTGVGAFEQALKRLKIKHNTIFACDKDKFARKSYLANNDEPNYFPEDVYEREITEESLDFYVSTPPCQTFSFAGQRKGEEDERGVLFYNSHKFIKKNKPRFFIFENVKGLLSDDKVNKKDKYGRTFSTWLNLLGGKSINGNPIIFPDENSVPYHIYFKVLNAKDFNVPQNRERVFIVGIRDDFENYFKWPKPKRLEKRLKDVLEDEVEEKFYLSKLMLENITFNGSDKGIVAHLQKAGQKGKVFSENSDFINCLTSTDYKLPKPILIGAIRGRSESNPKSRKKADDLVQTLELNENGVSNTLTTVLKDNVVVVVGNLKGGKWENTLEHSCRVYGTNGVAATLTTMSGGNQKPKIFDDFRVRRLTPRECFRLMDFPDAFKFVVSNSQLYKQAGNSVVVKMYEIIVKSLLKIE